MELAIATNNADKAQEFSRILAPIGIRARSMKELGVTLDVEETGSVFEENAYLKAKALFEVLHAPVVADDSGIEVDALDGRPGVYTARYAGEHATDEENIDKLLKDMEHVPQNQRTARFVCVLCVILNAQEQFFLRGTCEGTIGYARAGKGGFGYDPVFYVGGRSFAQLADGEKDAVSHRGHALRLLQEELRRRLNRQGAEE